MITHRRAVFITLCPRGPKRTSEKPSSTGEREARSGNYTPIIQAGELRYHAKLVDTIAVRCCHFVRFSFDAPSHYGGAIRELN